MVNNTCSAIANIPKKFTAETISLCEKIDHLQTLLLQDSIAMRTYSIASVEHFDSFEQEKKLQILNQFNSYLELCKNIKAEGISFRDNISVLKSALRQLGYRAPESFIKKLDNTDVIEVYNGDLLQVFRNIVFIELCSYTLLDVISNEWYNLYERHSSVTKSLIETAKQVFEIHDDTISFEIPAHSMREIFSEEQRIFEINHKYISPLFSSEDKKVAIIASQEAKLLTKNIPTQSLSYI